MGLFGSSRRKPWDLGGAWNQFDPSSPDYSTPPYVPGQSQFPKEAPPTAPPERQSWAEGGKATGRDALALALSAVGDTLAQRGGGQAWALPMMVKGRAESLASQAKRQQDRADYIWEQEHKAPTTNDTERDYEFWKQHMTPEQFTAFVQNKADPPQYRQGADGQFYRVSPQPGVPAPTTPAPWHTNPEDWQMVPDGPGGGAGNGAGNFRPSGNPLDPWPH